MASCPTCGDAMLTERPHVHRETNRSEDRQLCSDCGHPHLPMPRPWRASDGALIDPQCGWPSGPESCDCRRRRIGRVRAALAAPVAGLDVERLARAMNAWNGYPPPKGDETYAAEAIAAEYARLTEAEATHD